jgi:hypothetical protein
MFLSVLRELYKDTVTIESFTGLGKDGAPAFGAATTYTARCVGKDVYKGNQRIASVTTYLLAAPTTLTVRDRITLPARFVPRTPVIVAIQQEPDERGNCYVAVLT